MSTTQQVTVKKDQLLLDFSKLKKWLSQYWHFLENLPLDVFSKEEEVVEYLRTQHQDLISTKVKFQTLDMVGSVLNYSLERISPQQLTFQIPQDASTPKKYEYIENLYSNVHELEPSLQQIVEQVMYLSRHLPADIEEKFNPLLLTIGSLFKAIIRQDGDDMKVQLSHINLLTSTKESHLLLQEVGKITREIYDSLQGISEDLNTDQIRHATDEMPDAVQKLNSVIERLEEVANDNLGFLEELIEQGEQNINLVENLGEIFTSLDEMLINLGEKHTDITEELNPMRDLIQDAKDTKVEVLLKTFHENENSFITIMTNQGFQDLTGQTLKKIVNFLEHLELRLLELIQKFGPSSSDQMANKSAPDFMTRKDTGAENEDIDLHGPDETESKKSSQNDVDSLLAEMGF